MEKELTLAELLDLAAQAQAEKQQVQKAANPITVETLASLLSDLKTNIEAGIDERVQKAFPRSEGNGPRQTVAPKTESEADSDPIGYIVKKAANPEELTQEDKQLAWALTERALTDGLTY